MSEKVGGGSFFGYVSKNMGDFLGKGLGEGREERQKDQRVWVEGGSCSVNINGDNHMASLAMVPYKVDDLVETEPLDVIPVDVRDDRELPEIISFDWVVQRVKDLFHVVGLSYEGFEGRCWLCLQLSG
jgi:hypothetical protein